MDGYRKGFILELFTVGYNIIEAVVSILFGIIAGSPALFGFGLDSIVESLSGSVLLWRLHKHDKVSEEEEEKIERRAIRLVAVTFLILAIWVLYESGTSLYFRERPEGTVPGILIAVASLIVMPVLARMKKRTGKEIGSRALVADSKETLVCAWLSVALLFGLFLNYILGWWWADPLTGIIIAGFLIKEGIEQWREAGEQEDDD